MIATLETLPPPPPGRTGWPWTVASSPLAARRPDGSQWPRLTVVTPSHDQAEFLEETLRSVLLQGYPNLEYIVVDGGSKDRSSEIVERYGPWLAHALLEPDHGHAAALNHGFARATGEVLAFLNSDDTYLPGALARAAAEVDAAEGRHLVVGRCRFVDALGRWDGSEHPLEACSHWRVLAVWKGHAIPQPSAFWSRQAWDAGGPFDESRASPWIDYTLFCRMTRRHRVRVIDQALATYRLHSRSITVLTEERVKLEQILRTSREYWGSGWSPRHLTLALSLALHRWGRGAHARAAIERWRAARARAGGWRATGNLALGLALAPDLGWRLARGWARRRWRWMNRPTAVARPALLARSEPWADGWVGPRLRIELPSTGAERELHIEGALATGCLAEPLEVAVRIDGRRVGEARLEGDQAFAIQFPLPPGAGVRTVEIEAHPYFLADALFANGDDRPLCWRLGSATLRP